MNKFNRDFKFNCNFEIKRGIGFGIAIVNLQPKNKYKSAQWSFSIVFLCLIFNAELFYLYKQK